MTDTKTPNATKFKIRLKENPTTSYWLSRTIEEVDSRDPVNAMNDIIILKQFCELRLKDIQEYYK